VASPSTNYAQPKDQKPKTEQEELLAKMKERRDALQKGLVGLAGLVEVGRMSPDSLTPLAEKLLRAELDLAEKKADRIAAHERYLKITKAAEEVMEARVEIGTTPQCHWERTKADRMDAEIGLIRERKDKPVEGDEARLQTLLKDRRAALRAAHKDLSALMEGAIMTVDVVYETAERLLAAELELVEKAPDRIALHEEYVKGAKAIEVIIEKRHNDGRLPAYAYGESKANRMRAEIGLIRARRDKPAEGDGDRLKTLLKERRTALRAMLKDLPALVEDGKILPEPLFRANGELLGAELELAEKPEQRVTAHEEAVKRLKDLEAVFDKQLKDGRITDATFEEAKAARLAAEIGLLREKARPPENK
jgi:hypothetical protein